MTSIHEGDRVVFNITDGRTAAGTVFRVTPRRGGTMISIHADEKGSTFARCADRVTVINCGHKPPMDPREILRETERARAWAGRTADTGTVSRPAVLEAVGDGQIGAPDLIPHDAKDPAVISSAHGITWDLFGDVETMNRWLDRNNAPSADEDGMRVMKIGEEVGEAYEALGEVAQASGRAAAAYIGWRGQNPRKGRTHSQDDLLAELSDVVLTALVAMQHFTQDKMVTAEHLAAKVAQVLARIPQVPCRACGSDEGDHPVSTDDGTCPEYLPDDAADPADRCGWLSSQQERSPRRGRHAPASPHEPPADGLLLGVRRADGRLRPPPAGPPVLPRTPDREESRLMTATTRAAAAPDCFDGRKPDEHCAHWPDRCCICGANTPAASAQETAS